MGSHLPGRGACPGQPIQLCFALPSEWIRCTRPSLPSWAQLKPCAVLGMVAFWVTRLKNLLRFDFVIETEGDVRFHLPIHPFGPSECLCVSGKGGETVCKYHKHWSCEMYTYCDEGGAVAAHGIGFLSGVGAGGQDSCLRSWKRFLPALCYTAEPTTTPLPLKWRRPTWFVAQWRAPCTPPLNSISINPHCLSLLLPMFVPKKLAQCTICFS